MNLGNVNPKRTPKPGEIWKIGYPDDNADGWTEFNVLVCDIITDNEGDFDIRVLVDGQYEEWDGGKYSENYWDLVQENNETHTCK